MKKTALVLQGGGALGAYQYGAIQAIYEKDPNFNPVIVTGVSIGAINAAVMLGGKYGPVESLKRLWDHVKMDTLPFFPQSWQARTSKLGNPNMYYINPNYIYSPLTAKSIYDIRPFREFLADLIDFKQLNKNSTELVVESVNVETGALTRFSNRDKDGMTLDKVISSMSIPPNFPYVKVDNQYYWDGGLFANLPLAPAINCLEEVTKHQENVKREIIVINLFRKNATLPETIADISDRVKEIIFESKLNIDENFFKKIDGMIDLFQEIDKVLPKDDKGDKIRDNVIYKDMMDRKKIDSLIKLQYEAEGVEGTDNFTSEAIESRIRIGHRDASNKI